MIEDEIKISSRKDLRMQIQMRSNFPEGSCKGYEYYSQMRSVSDQPNMSDHINFLKLK